MGELFQNGVGTPRPQLLGKLATERFVVGRVTKQFASDHFLAVDAGDERVDDDQFARRLQAEGQKNPQPDLHIRGDRDVRYERVAQAMAAAQQAGLKKIGFITEPQRP